MHAEPETWHMLMRRLLPPPPHFPPGAGRGARAPRPRPGVG